MSKFKVGDRVIGNSTSYGVTKKRLGWYRHRCLFRFW